VIEGGGLDPVDRGKLTESLGLGCAGLIALWALFGSALVLVASLDKVQIQQISHLKAHLATIGVWAGAMGGLLAGIDWITPVLQKARLKEILVSVWVWLAEQRAGRFTTLLYKESAQRCFALLSHATLIFFLILLVGKRAGHFKGIPLHLEVGKPRIYPFQVWVDIGAVILSSWFFGWKLYPRLAAWIASVPSLFRYFLRALGTLALGVILMFFMLLLELPIYLIQLSATHKEHQAPTAKAVAAAFHGQAVVIVLHALTAVITAPVLAGTLMIQYLVFCSLYWIILVWAVILILRSFQFFIERIVSGNQGPVLAASALLAAISSAIKIFG
jgi:hypothetical protein